MSESALPLTDDGNWLQLLRPASTPERRPALFLDRDGVVVVEQDYLSRPEDVVLLRGAAETIAAANRAGWAVVMVTNQSGVGRGYFGWAAFAAVQTELLRQLAAHDAHIDLVLACPFHAEAREPYRHDDHPWRKPRPGMLHAALSALPIDPGRSWMVGDHVSDVIAAREAGLAGAFHVLTGHGARHRVAALAAAGPGFAVTPVPDLGAVAAALRLPGDRSGAVP